MASGFCSEDSGSNLGEAGQVARKASGVELCVCVCVPQASVCLLVCVYLRVHVCACRK